VKRNEQPPKMKTPQKPTRDKHAIPAGEAEANFSDYVAVKPKHAGGRPTKYDPAYCEAVIEDMANGYSLTAFAGSIGVNRSTITEWVENFPEFSAAVSRAKAARLRNWEQAALDIRKSGGTGGSATITVFGLKNMGDDEWRDISRQEQTGPEGGPIVHTVTRIERVIVDAKANGNQG
jgi:hypothetical protein